MSDRLEVDADGLAADGRELAEIGDPTPKAEACKAPASDPVSTSMAAALTADDEGLCQRFGEAKAIREHGGAIVTAAGVMFEVADEHNALQIDKVSVHHTPRAASAAPPTIAIPKKPNQAKTTPPIPEIQEQTLEPEAFAEAIHSGAGESGVWDFSRRWRKTGDDLDSAGDMTKFRADRIEEHWRDSKSSASSKVRSHGTWLHKGSERAKKLSTTADSCASAFHTVRSETPTPEQLDTAKLAAEMGAASPVVGMVAFMKYQGLKNKAIEAGQKYHDNVQSAVHNIRKPLDAPELIAERAEIPKDLTRGPGQWVSKVRRSGPWRDYEMQATGFPAGMEYEIIGPDHVAVSFDGYDADNGVLYESKGTGYAWMVGPDGDFDPNRGPATDIPDELLRQYRVAEAQGIPVEWRVAEPKTAAAIQRIIDREGYDDLITVEVVPPQ